METNYWCWRWLVDTNSRKVLCQSCCCTWWADPRGRPQHQRSDDCLQQRSACTAFSMAQLEVDGITSEDSKRQGTDQCVRRAWRQPEPWQEWVCL